MRALFVRERRARRAFAPSLARVAPRRSWRRAFPRAGASVSQPLHGGPPSSDATARFSEGRARAARARTRGSSIDASSRRSLARGRPDYRPTIVSHPHTRAIAAHHRLARRLGVWPCLRAGRSGQGGGGGGRGGGDSALPRWEGTPPASCDALPRARLVRCHRRLRRLHAGDSPLASGISISISIFCGATARAAAKLLPLRAPRGLHARIPPFPCALPASARPPATRVCRRFDACTHVLFYFHFYGTRPRHVHLLFFSWRRCSASPRRRALWLPPAAPQLGSARVAARGGADGS